MTSTSSAHNKSFNQTQKAALFPLVNSALGSKHMAPEDQPDVKFTITSDEAIVLFEFLQRFSNTEKLGIEDQAEERALWNLCCVFEKYLTMPFDKDYPELLREARGRLRDEP